MDLSEKGAKGQSSNRRLFMQLQAFGNCPDPEALKYELQKSGLETILYLDLNDPQGCAVLYITEDPLELARSWRCALSSKTFLSLQRKPGLTMTGRTYSGGYEPDLEDWLLQRPRRYLKNPEWPWAVWYPLRRKAVFERLTPEEQGQMMREHGGIGRKYGEAGLAGDVRLACHGLDTHDNDFVIGLMGPELHSLSRCVQDMRGTRQTAEYMQSLGPFFVGKVYWVSTTVRVAAHPEEPRSGVSKGTSGA
ncbi:MAG: chlorite dismutase family protein [Candidatus Omnitrophica bacterium]|nr:chlorite dismutase family protein [Candidatus Omnitrophota bacterium]